MPLNDSRAGITPGVSVIPHAQRINDADAQRIVDEFELSDRKELQRQFDHWAVFYREIRTNQDKGTTPSAVRDKAKRIANYASRLAKELADIDPKTRLALGMFQLDQAIREEMSDDIAGLSKYGIVTVFEDPTPNGLFELGPVAGGVRFLARRAGEIEKRITATMRATGHKKPVLYESSNALMMLIQNIRTFWEEQGFPYTRSFDDWDDEGDKPDAIPSNPASRFTMRIVSQIAPTVTARQVERAMKEQIKAFGLSQITTGQKK